MTTPPELPVITGIIAIIAFFGTILETRIYWLHVGFASLTITFVIDPAEPLWRGATFILLCILIYIIETRIIDWSIERECSKTKNNTGT